jgi:hypothetical protein
MTGSNHGGGQTHSVRASIAGAGNVHGVGLTPSVTEGGGR